MRTVIFDLDETLVAPVKRKRSHFTVTVPALTHAEAELTVKHLKIRPGATELIAYCAEHFRVAVWSMAQPLYVQALVPHLFSQVELAFVYDWTHCYREGPKVYKCLGFCPGPLSDLQIIDDRPDLIYERDRCLPVQAYRGQAEDTDLFRVLHMLRTTG